MECGEAVKYANRWWLVVIAAIVIFLVLTSRPMTDDELSAIMPTMAQPFTTGVNLQ